MSLTLNLPFPLFDSYHRIAAFNPDEYGETHRCLQTIFAKSPEQETTWQLALEYLQFVARNKAEGTFDRFRSECERFLLWLWLKNDESKTLTALTKIDLLSYIDFICAPDEQWIGHDSTVRRFISDGKQQTINVQWRPFVQKSPTHNKNKQMSQASIQASFTALSTFFTFLVDMQQIGKNPVPAAKKDCRHLYKDKQVASVHRLNELQWQTVLDSAEQLTQEHVKYERNLFLVACLKTLYLRISELSERKAFVPCMQHFWFADGYWWLKVFGKGNKIRDISVPNDFLPFLTRYRRSRGLSDFPNPHDHSPIVSNLSGNKGLTARQLRRLVQQVFDHAYHQLNGTGMADEAMELKAATTHWLRHTGASIDIENNRDIKYLSEDLGHASIATTDKIYVQTDIRNRAESGKYRKV